MIVIEIGYESYVLPTEKALQLIEILELAERYERKYWSKDERESRGMKEEYTYHVYPNDKQYNMKIISDDMYRMAKLAGKPEKD